MKNTLEYKILKHLSDNDNGNFIEISSLHDNRKLLENRVRELKQSDLLNWYPSTGLGKTKLPIKCSIRPEGNKWLYDLDLTTDNKPVTNHNYNNVSQVNQSSGNIDLKSPIKQKIIHNKEITPPKRSKLEILSWIAGIIGGCFALYEFILKQFIG